MPNIPRQEQIRLGVLSDWMAGRVAIGEQQDLDEWMRIVDDLAHELGERLEIVVNHETGLGFARVNKNFPLNMRPYTSEAKAWMNEGPQVAWKEQLNSWNRLFGGQGRDIC
jgi:hypothetical protein